MLKLAGVTSTDVLYDLGCGDGRAVIRAAKDFGAQGMGMDINVAEVGTKEVPEDDVPTEYDQQD